MSKTVIEVEKLYKEYRLGEIGYGTLREDFQTWWAKIRGKEDPNSLISYTDDHSKAEKEHILALNNISFEVEEGEILGVIGKNGSGKSTLLKVLSRITAPTKGIAKIKGRIGSLLEVGTGFHPELTGRENVYLNGTILGMKKKEVDDKFDEIVEFAEVEKFIDTPVKRYSSGMYVRLAFAVAANLDPEILIVDEVLAVGDAEFQKKCIGKMSDVAKGGRTVLFVSHNMSSIRRLCNKCILLNRGEIVASGECNKIVDKYESLNVTHNDCWSNSLDAQNVKYFDIEEVALYDSKNKIKNVFLSNEKIYAKVKVVLDESHPKELLSLDFLKNSEVVFRYPMFINGSEKLKKGKYEFVFELPDNIFNSGDYLISVSGSLYCIEMIFDYERIVNFSIELVIPEGFSTMANHPGVIFPKIKSKIKKISSAS